MARTEPILCTDCQHRSDEQARAVAAYIPQFDLQTDEDLRSRLSTGMLWDLDDNTNILYCSGNETGAEESHPSSSCPFCGPYYLHLSAAIAGFARNEDHQQYKEVNAPQSYMERIHAAMRDALADDNSPTNQSALTFPDDVPQPTPEPDPTLLHHMQLVTQLQSVRGRRIINAHLQSDDAAKGRLKGLSVALTTGLALATKRRDDQLARVTELQAELQHGLDEVNQLENTLEALEAKRPRKISSPALRIAEPSASQFTSPSPPDHLFRNLTLRSTISAPHLLRSLCNLQDSPNLSHDKISDLRRILMEIPAPAFDQPPEIYARWLQAHRHSNIKGIPSCAPDWVVDLRDVRGRNTVMSRVPPRGNTQPQRYHHRLCLTAVLKVLAIPRAYTDIVQRLGIHVADVVDLSCQFHERYSKPPTKEEVIRRLARQGLTPEMADDCWQFCIKFLQADASTPHSVLGSDTANILLRHAIETSDSVGCPEGIHPTGQDLLSRLPAL
ncbi:hypothetical protein C8R43DRAFT_963524 [Mycena crocata]|nr:hypothetical protein C8R43DRAFT_963524 [Mycena crocata]